eukprot:PhM_4_TR4476/c0_g1_i1/m.40742
MHCGVELRYQLDHVRALDLLRALDAVPVLELLKLHLCALLPQQLERLPQQTVLVLVLAVGVHEPLDAVRLPLHLAVDEGPRVGLLALDAGTLPSKDLHELLPEERADVLALEDLLLLDVAAEDALVLEQQRTVQRRDAPVVALGVVGGEAWRNRYLIRRQRRERHRRALEAPDRDSVCAVAPRHCVECQRPPAQRQRWVLPLPRELDFALLGLRERLPHNDFLRLRVAAEDNLLRAAVLPDALVALLRVLETHVTELGAVAVAVPHGVGYVHALSVELQRVHPIRGVVRRRRHGDRALCGVQLQTARHCGLRLRPLP